jgi:hypothetical protein
MRTKAPSRSSIATARRSFLGARLPALRGKLSTVSGGGQVPDSQSSQAVERGRGRRASDPGLSSVPGLTSCEKG